MDLLEYIAVSQLSRLTFILSQDKAENKDSVMDIDDKPGGLQGHIIGGLAADSREDNTDMSLRNHPDSQPRGSKRINDESVPNVTTTNFYSKKNKHEDRDETLSQSSSGHEHGGNSSSIEHMSGIHAPLDDSDQPSTALLKDLETRAITVSQLIQEVKGIYAGLGQLLPSSE